MPLFDSFPGAVSQGPASIGSTASQAVGALGTIAGTAGRVSGALNSAQSAAQSISALRSINLPPGGNPVARFAAGAALFNGAVGQAVGAVGSIAGAVGAVTGAVGAIGGALTGASSVAGAIGALAGLGGAFGGGSGDWRARISGAIGELVFPYTPTIAINGGAQYEETPITHQNYAFYSYQNSKAESISITAPYYVEDAMQAQQWIKAVNFLRAATKMFPDGNPPIILKFNAYGDYVFKDIPVIVKTYSVDLPSGVDYIASGSSHVPIKSNFSVSLQPIYSREKIKTFNLYSFINGGSAGFV